MLIYVDIDNTICTTVGEYPSAKPILENITKINKLYDEGNTIVYWTARGGTTGIDWTELTKKQLEEWNCRYHRLEIGKPSYDICIDDKSINLKDIFFSESNKITGIYQICSKINPEKIYIGSAINIHIRWNRHLSDLKNNRHHSKKLQNHYDKYGESDLLFSIILRCRKKELIKYEQHYLDLKQPFFNNRKIADSNLGIIFTDEHKKKISEALKGKKKSFEHIKKIGETSKGRHLSEEAKQKLREFNLGKKLSDEHKRKISESKRGKHYGFVLSDEQRKKISESKRGKKLSDETKRKISEKLMGNKNSLGHKRKKNNL